MAWTTYLAPGRKPIRLSGTHRPVIGDTVEVGRQRLSVGAVEHRITPDDDADHPWEYEFVVWLTGIE